MSALPEPVARLRKLIHVEPSSFGPSLQALTASKNLGLILVLEPKQTEDIAWLISGLQSGAKLLVAGEDQQQFEALKPALDVDLRVGFHVQEIKTFLKDIAHHRFDLIYCGYNLDDASAQSLQEMLNFGGFLIADETLNPALVDMPAEKATLVPFPLNSVENQPLKIYVKTERVLKRRGGRLGKTSGKSGRSSLRSLT